MGSIRMLAEGAPIDGSNTVNRRSSRGWTLARMMGMLLHPSLFFGTYWILALLFVELAGETLSLSVSVWLLVAVYWAAISLGAVIGSSPLRSGDRRSPLRPKLVSLHFNTVIGVAVTAGVFGCVLLVVTSGRSVSSWSSPLDLFSVGRHFMSLRYGAREAPSVLLNIANVLLYLGILCSGLSLGVKSSRRAVMTCALLLGLGLLQAFLVSARTGLVWMSAFLFASYLTGAVLAGRQNRLVSPKRLLIVIVAFFSVITLVFVIQTIRENNTFRIPVATFDKTMVTILSPPVAFSAWLNSKAFDVDPAFGTRTFGGPSNLLGLYDRGLGLNWEPTGMRYHGRTYYPNVYTGFRQLIEDATLPGSILVMLAFGILAGWAYRGVRCGQVVAVPCLMLFYGVVLGSYIANWLTYTTLLAAWVVFFSCFIIPAVRKRTLSMQWGIPIQCASRCPDPRISG